MANNQLTRRKFMAGSTAAVAATSVLSGNVLAATDGDIAYQALGTRVGEMTESSAVVWTRITANPMRNNQGLIVGGRAKEKRGQVQPEVTVPVDQLEGACPAGMGRLRLRYGTRAELIDANTTPWVEVNEANDGIHKFKLTELAPGTLHYFESQSAGLTSIEPQVVRGQFYTAPRADIPSDLRFCVMTCQGYPDRGHPDGHEIYPSMLALAPQFACLTGDLVYYDNDLPQATTPRLARYHWERMFSLPRLIEFTRSVGAYWLKDDHDTLDNDSGPGDRFGSLTFAEGQQIFLQQAPAISGPSYRTFRWGRDLQIWFTDGRDFRSPNKQPDGPTKTIWGAEQKAWFKRTVLESDATWKVLISPTPLVGPDRPTGKNDNHSNAGFQTEGDEIRSWLKAHVPDNFFVICGDRHWQYHSIDPLSGVREFSVGAASDQHAGGTPGEDLRYHKFHRVQGGFLSVDVRSVAHESEIVFRLHDVNGTTSFETSERMDARHDVD